MLARLPLPYLLLMAATATALLCLATYRWLRPPRAAIAAVAAMSVAACLGMAGVGAVESELWSARQMLVLYSFCWTGLALGLFLIRHGLTAYGDQVRRDPHGPPPPFPTGYVVVFCAAVAAMCALAYLAAN
ncbi:hypothetical protein [Streptomyces flavalbus]|uniref:Uncharacterized protein n=1 Tax=Streptomyces flavalbus TaxID=2665155 RepID=A0ABW2WEU9_9ACTN